MFRNIFKIVMPIFFLMLVAFSQNSYAQLSGSYTIPGSPFATVKSAFDSLNLVGVGSGGVTINITAGYTESTTDSLILTATGTVSNPIVFQKSGVGANPLITRTDAGSKTTSTLGGQGDAVIIIQGSDYVTFDGIDVAASDQGIEYGYYLRKVDGANGCKYVTIKNSVIDLTKGTSAYVVGIYSSNNNPGSSVSSATGITITSTDGRNEYVTLTSNTIQDVHAGIILRGFNHTTTPNDFQDFNFVVGTSGQGNIIQNYAGGSPTTSYGVYLINQTNPTVSYNSIDNAGNGGSASTAQIYGIFMSQTATNPGGIVVMNNNNITINHNHTSALAGITISPNCVSITVNYNNFSIGTFASTGLSYLINVNGPASSTKEIIGNRTVGTITKTANGQFICINSSGNPTTSAVETFSDNKFSGISVSAGTNSSSITGIIVTSSATITRYFHNNKVSGITMGTGTFTGLSVGNALINEVYNDTVMSCTGTGSANGISSSASATGLVETIRDNYVTGLNFAGGTGTFTGIATGGVSFTSTRYLYNNTVTNCSGGSGFQSYGINSGNITNQEIYNNTVSGITVAGNLKGLAFVSQSSGLSTVYNNTVYDVTTTGNSAAIGISNESAGTTYFYKNSVSKLRATNVGTTTTVRGIDVTIGYKNYVYNNLVSDMSAPNTTATGNVVMGINSTNNSNQNTIYLYNNTVYFNSTGTTYRSFGIYSNSSHYTELRNNLVVNNSAGLAFAYGRTTIAGQNSLNTYSLLSDNNNFYSGYRIYAEVLNNTTFTYIDTTISQFKTRFYPREQSSFSESSPFVNVSTAPFDVHINTTTASQTESGGAPVTTPIAITNDYDGDVRNTTNPDVGADEFSGITTDLTGPVISYAPLGFTGSVVDRILVVNISDRSGVTSTIPGMPILYWKKNYNGTWTADTVSTVVGNDFTFNFGGGVALNDTVFYYVAAQDGATTPNVRIVPTPGSGGYTSNPPAAATPPTNPDWYKISNVSLAGDYTVGVAEFNRITGRTISFEKSGDKLIPMENGKTYTGDLYVKKAEHPEYNYPDNVQGVYTTLTSAVNDLNLRGVTAPVNFLLTDTLYDGTTNTFPLVIKVLNENLPTAVNQVTLKPNTGVTSKIKHSLATNTIFKILSKYINIDGSNSGGTDRSLTIENSSTTSPRVIWYGSVGTNPISWCTVKNCKIIVPGAAIDGYGVSIADSAMAPTAGYSNNMTVQNNYITGPYGVYVFSPVINNIIVPGNGSGLSINGNTIDSSYNGGMYLFGLDNISVTNNTVSNIRGTSGGAGYFIYTGYVMNSSVSNNIIGPNSWVAGVVTGIRVGSNLVNNSNLIVSGNTISGLINPSAATVFGILLEQQTGGVEISNNKISNIKQTNATSRTSSGIYINGGIPNGNITVANNFIWDIASNGDANLTANNAYGIYISSFTAGANGYKLYHNTVALTTDQTFATGNPACLNIQGLSATNPLAVDIRDNIFANFMTVGTNRYAVICNAPNTILANIDYNDYYVTSGSNLGRLQTTNIADITAWRTATGKDVNSISADPKLVSATDLHADTNFDIVDGKGFYLATVPQDIDGDTRNNPSDIGADEYTFTPPADPTTVIATAVSETQIDVAFTPNVNSNNVVIVWNTTGLFSTPSGTPPSVGQPFAGGTVLSNGIVSPINHTGLTPLTTYYYKLFSYNGTYYSSGVLVSDTTLSVADPSAVTATTISDTQITIVFTTNADTNNVIIVWNLTGTFTTPSGTPPLVDSAFAGGTVLYNGITSPVNHTGLTASTAYYYKLFSYNGTYYSPGVAVNTTTYSFVEDPTSVTASSLSDTQINVAFTPNANSNNVVIVFNTWGTFETPSGPPPAIGEWFAGGTLLDNTITSPYSHTGLNPNSTYYYKLFSYNGTNYSSGVTVNATTLVPPPGESYAYNGGVGSYGTINLTTGAFTSWNFRPQGSSYYPVTADNDTLNSQYAIISDFGFPAEYYLMHVNFTTLSGDSIAPVGPLASGQNVIKGMAYNKAADTWYVISGNDIGSAAYLYTLNTTTGVLTVVGQIQNANVPVGIAINCNGNAYIINVVSGLSSTAVLNSLNLTTAVATAIGTDLGLADVTGFSQDMDFNPDNGNLYWSGYWSSGWFSEGGSFRLVNVATGTSTQISTFGQYETITGFNVNGFCPAVSTFQLSVNVTNGWNMVSIPGLHPVDQNVNTWWQYRDLGADVFKYLGGYQAVTTAAPGTGYWMKHSGYRTYNTGEEWPAGGLQVVTHDPLSAQSGWNMIGGYELIVGTAGVTTNPPGLQSGPIYKYSSGYQVATSLDPGYGYWIKLNAAGQIIIPETLAKENGANEWFPADWGKIIISDATGVNYTLYAVKGETDLSQYELPPAPMAGMFDIRFSSGRIAEDINSSVKTIDMSGVTYPLTVRVEGMDIRLMDESGKALNLNLKKGEDVVISDATIQKLMVSGELIPAEYALEQNYPNPFNPSTVIEFSLPENVGNVQLSIYNALGEKVAELVNTGLTAGRYSYQWNASNVATGMYIYELRTDKFVSVKKMLLLK